MDIDTLFMLEFAPEKKATNEAAHETTLKPLHVNIPRDLLPLMLNRYFANVLVEHADLDGKLRRCGKYELPKPSLIWDSFRFGGLQLVHNGKNNVVARKLLYRWMLKFVRSLWRPSARGGKELIVPHEDIKALVMWYMLTRPQWYHAREILRAQDSFVYIDVRKFVETDPRCNFTCTVLEETAPYCGWCCEDCDGPLDREYVKKSWRDMVLRGY